MGVFTVAELAEKAGISKQAIRKRAARLNLRPELDAGSGKQAFSEADALRILGESDNQQPTTDNQIDNQTDNQSDNRQPKPTTEPTTNNREVTTGEAGAGDKNPAESAENRTFSGSDNRQPGTDNRQPTTDNQSDNQSDNRQPEATTEAELLREMIELLKNQLSEKDKQIEALSSRLAEALQLTGRQQYITAAATAAPADPEETEAQGSAAAAEQPAEQKRSFWRRVFGGGKK